MRPFATKRSFVPSLRIDDPARTRAPARPRPSALAAAEPVVPGFDEPADVYFQRQARGLGYRHFETVEAALRYVRDTLTPHQLNGCVIQVGERRLEAADVARLVRQLAPAAPPPLRARATEPTA